MSSNVKWGVVAGLVAVIAGVVWAGMQMYRPGDGSGDTGREMVSEQQEATGGDSGETSRAADGTARESADEATTDSTTAAGQEDETDSELQAEAESYVSGLAEPSKEPVPMEQAETFVGPDRPLAADADEAATESGAPSQDDSAGEGEQGLVAEGDDAQARTPDQTADGSGEEAREADTERRETGAGIQGGDAGGDDLELAGMEPEVPAEAPAGEEAGSVPPPETAEPVNEQAASTEAGADDSPAQDASAETGAEATDETRQPRIDLPLTEESPITIAELLGPQEDIPPDAVYYVHTVRPENDQGIWGIVHHGILENFAEGVAVHRGEKTRTYQVDIPQHADEKEADESSSFLGKLIYEKSRQSYVYNFETERLGRNPDLIIPGQEIVIVSFTPEELIAIYKHFARQEG